MEYNYIFDSRHLKMNVDLGVKQAIKRGPAGQQFFSSTSVEKSNTNQIKFRDRTIVRNPNDLNWYCLGDL